MCVCVFFFNHIKMEAPSPIMKRMEIKYANSQRKDIIRAIIGSVVFTAAHLHKSLIVFSFFFFFSFLQIMFISVILLSFFPPPLPPSRCKVLCSTKIKSLQLSRIKASQPRSDGATQRFLSAQVCTTRLDIKQEVTYRLLQTCLSTFHGSTQAV